MELSDEFVGLFFRQFRVSTDAVASIVAEPKVFFSDAAVTAESKTKENASWHACGKLCRGSVWELSYLLETD
jgi:hypothetical protein